MRETKLKLTSVKVYKPLYHKFKVRAMDDEFTLQKLVNRADTAVLTVHIKDTAIVGGTGY